MQDSERDWETLQKNVSNILKKKVSIKDLKHITAVLNVMESVGMDFAPDMQEAAGIATTMQAIGTVGEIELSIDRMRDMLLNGEISMDTFQAYYAEIQKKNRIRWIVPRSKLEKALKRQLVGSALS